jgi:hypothetical protein
MNHDLNIHIVIALTCEDFDRYIKANNLPRNSFYISKENDTIKILGLGGGRTYNIHITEMGLARVWLYCIVYSLLNKRGCAIIQKVKIINPSPS